MHRTGGPKVLRPQRVDRPVPGPGEVLLEVRAVSVSHTDLLIREGTVPAGPLPHIPGGEAAGLVRDTRSDRFSVGDHVLASSDRLGRDRSGTYADFLTASAGDLYPMPAGVSFVAAAAVGRPFSSAWRALLVDGGLGASRFFGARERVLISAASSGVGSAAVQIARWRGATVVAISSGNKATRLMSLGAHRVISRSAPDLGDRVVTAFGGSRASLILDLVGKDTLRESVAMLEPHGRIVCVGTLSGKLAELDAQALISKEVTIVGSAGAIEAEVMTEILRLVAEGTFHPVIDSILPLSAAASAHQRLGDMATFGRIVLVPDQVYESGREELVEG